MGSRLFPITAEEKKKRDAIILRLYEQDYSVQRIADHIGKKRIVVYNRLRALGVRVK